MSDRITILRALVDSHAGYSETQKFDISLGALRELFQFIGVLKANCHEKELLIREQAADIAMLRALVKVSA